MNEEQKHLSEEVKILPNGLRVSYANRFVILVFGDLKNYVYHYRFAQLEISTTHVNQVKANLCAKVFGKEKSDHLKEALAKVLIKDESVSNVEVSFV